MKYLQNNSAQRTKWKGFTLTEIMIAATISVLVFGFAAAFMIQATRASLRTQSASQNDLTEWGIYQGIAVDTRTANGMTLYKTFSNPSDFDSSSKQIIVNTTRGDFLVLSQSTQQANAQRPTYISLTGYVYQDGSPANTGKGTFKKFTFAVPTGERNNTLETILTNNINNFKWLTVAEGLNATNSDNDSTNPVNRAFLYRSTKLRSGVLNLQVNTGYIGTRTADAKLIETAFFIRS
jgi:prepilin-type N-terminal cleavage/methylation domain-containing protein